MREGPLDMRMSQSGESAADLVNNLDQEELANLLYAFGEERKSRRIAQFIVAARETAPITTTLELARIIEKAIGRKPDRIVKRFFDPDKGGPAQSRHLPQLKFEPRRWDPVAKAIKPGAAELDRNPRARSSVLRSAVRTEVEARAVSHDQLGVPVVRGAA
ncbi:hypothetical protein HA402_005564 [Bradysia odoriphaga]|nr:hypothetical protein HA402_005564 [Bradysia odoriphaga]